MNQTNAWDVIVIGGGPAGMMAAATAAGRGKRVLLLEKNPNVGKKLLITGGGRCNVTNNKPVVRDMLHHYKAAGKFLFTTFMQHGVKESIEWFSARGVALKEENEGRMFPETNSAETIRDVLVSELTKTHVTVLTKTEVRSVTHSGKIFSVKTTTGDFVTPSCVIASGGTSRPETGATGDGYVWLSTLGHTVVPNSMALVPLAVHDAWPKTLSGLTLPKVKLTVFADKKKQVVREGKLLFTHVGITGPTVLNLSKTVGELLEHSTVVIHIDLLPDRDAGAMKQYLHELFTEQSNKKVKNVLSAIVPTALATAILEQTNINGETPCHSIRSEERKLLLTTLKALPLSIKGLLGSDKAVVSAGGVTLEEVDFKTMESRLIPGLYIIGDMLNIDRPSGGYSLQLCWSTGYVAGSHA